MLTLLEFLKGYVPQYENIEIVEWEHGGMSTVTKGVFTDLLLCKLQKKYNHRVLRVRAIEDKDFQPEKKLLITIWKDESENAGKATRTD